MPVPVPVSGDADSLSLFCPNPGCVHGVWVSTARAPLGDRRKQDSHSDQESATFCHGPDQAVVVLQLCADGSRWRWGRGQRESRKVAS